MAFELWPGSRAHGRAKETLVHANALYNLARYLTRDPRDAEDLVQETYERALRAWNQREWDTNVKAWLFRILRNAFISRYRQEARRPALELDTTEQAPEAAIGDGSGSTPGGAELEQMRRLSARSRRRARSRPLADALHHRSRRMAHVDREPFGRRWRCPRRGGNRSASIAIKWRPPLSRRPLCVGHPGR